LGNYQTRKGRQDEDDESLDIRIANLVAIESDFEKIVHKGFRETIKTFEAALWEFDLSRKDPKDEINNWVNEKTVGKIQSILCDPTPPATIMFLLNAIYFHGKWMKPFDSMDTSLKDFHNSDGTTNKRMMMEFLDTSETIRYGEDEQVKIIELPYHGKASMFMIIENQSNASGMEELLMNKDHTYLRRLCSSVSRHEEIFVQIPKFKINYEKSLQEPLEKLGMNSVWTDGADFSSISDLPIKLDFALHKALLEVDEEGTKAAAVTATAVFCTSMPLEPPPRKEFIADRPFAVVIRDKINNINLFFGLINKLKW